MKGLKIQGVRPMVQCFPIASLSLWPPGRMNKYMFWKQIEIPQNKSLGKAPKCGGPWALDKFPPCWDCSLSKSDVMLKKIAWFIEVLEML